ncbi:NfeD family protein [Brevundimonas sp. 2R-24]|uniref:NfeD family protein n=1 Tax=Peiella sedimenti TaxID=3061083 RepID=A0ABT8SIL6_9CAUL|nr:NfeD family protein [Caulobacteraceae bacterium XZ-24]
MDAIVAIYQSQPFWIWLAIGALILAVEAAAGTEWLLWPAVAAVVVAGLTAMGLGGNPLIEIVIFAVLTLAFTFVSRKLVKQVNPEAADINDRGVRLIGQRAQVVEPFVGGRGRVFVSGSEWPADLEGEAPGEGQAVVVEAVAGPRLKVRAA